MNTGGYHNQQQQQQQQEPLLASISASVGWNFPQVKLASWDPENMKQWRKGGGQEIAHRNLLVSIPNLFAAFAVWLVWSIIASKIQLMHDQDPTIYPFQDWGTPKGSDYNILLYTLPSVAGLSGGTLRIANSFMTQIVGGRNVVGHSSIMLTIAMILTAIVLNSKTTPFSYLLIAAWLSGTGGGAFASSMSNISFLYPKRKLGYCLGFNGGLGNFGVCITQLVLPIIMGLSFGKDPLAYITRTTTNNKNDDSINGTTIEILQPIEGWPNNVGWFWWPFCTLCAIAAFIWMSNLPDHGNHCTTVSSTTHNNSSNNNNDSMINTSHTTNSTNTTSNSTTNNNNNSCNNNDYIWNMIYYYWFEGVSLIVSCISIIILVQTRNTSVFTSSPGRKVLHSILLVVIASILQHIALYVASPKSCMPLLKEQYQIFHDKHTYIMTLLYIMSFGSFIGFSGAFPKLITDIFGYISTDGCYYNSNTVNTIADDIDDDTMMIFIEGGTEFDCIANGGIKWGESTITNPNAPNVFRYAWLGPCVGSLIRPIGGMLADKHGGSKVTQIVIVWCTLTTLCLGILVAKTTTSNELRKNPELNFSLFVFLFLNIFLCTGILNGTTFRTIGVLFNHKLAGTVLGWSSAIASYGAFVIPSMFSVSISSGNPQVTLYCLSIYYFFCCILNYYYYCRPNCERPGV